MMTHGRVFLGEHVKAMQRECAAWGHVEHEGDGQCYCGLATYGCSYSGPVPDPNWYGEFKAINQREPTDAEILQAPKAEA